MQVTPNSSDLDEAENITEKLGEAIKQSDFERLATLLSRREFLLKSILEKREGTRISESDQSRIHHILNSDETNLILLKSLRKRLTDEVSQIAKGKVVIGQYLSTPNNRPMFIDQHS